MSDLLRNINTPRFTCIDHRVTFIQELRTLDLKKVPAISETIDWAKTLILLHTESLDADMVKQTLNVILKFQEDIETVEGEVQMLTNKALKAQ